MDRDRTESRSTKGQAVTEMAIFGSLVIMVFGIWLSYAQTFTENQALQQQSFRMALRKAYSDNAFVSYRITKNPRSVSPSGNFREGERSSVSASSSVLWSLGEAESRSYYQINEDEIELPLAVVWDTQDAQTVYSATDRKEEDAYKIATTRSVNLQDTLTASLNLEDGSNIRITQGLGADGRYSRAAAGSVMTKGRTWETPHSTAKNPNP